MLSPPPPPPLGNAMGNVVECRPAVVADKTRPNKNNGAKQRKQHKSIRCENCRTLLQRHTPRPSCPTNALSNEHFRSDRIFLGPNELGTGSRCRIN